VVFEDLHWIDAETQALLNLLVDAIANARILLLVNYRPDYRHEWGSRTHYTQLRLDPLGNESADLMLTTLLGDSSELEALKRMIIKRTQGNPFFIEEIVRALFDDGVLVRNGTTRLARPLADIKVPQTVHSMLTSRIDRLPADEKELLRTLAVVGREFPLNLVKQLVQKPDDELDRLLFHLQVGEFIYEQPAFPESKYTFKHALTQEAAYNSLLIGRRKELHRHAATVIEALYRERLDDHLSELARHYSQSGDTWKAVEYLHLAAQQVAGRLVYEETVNHLAKALELLNNLPDGVERDRQELSLQTDLGQYLAALRGPAATEAVAAFARAQNLCEKLGEDIQLFWVVYALQWVHILRLELEVARDLGARQLALAERSGDSSMLMAAYAALVQTMFHLGEFRAAQELCEKGRSLGFVRQRFPLSEIGDPQTMILSLSSHVLFVLGYSDQALARSREALSEARQSGPHSLAFALSFAAELHREIGDEKTARELTEALASLAADRGFSLWSAQASFLQGQALVAEDRVEQGIAEICQGAMSFEMTGGNPGIWKLSLAEAYSKLGHIAEALTAIAEALDLVQRTGLHQGDVELYRVKGELTLRQATPDAIAAAETDFRRAIEIAFGQGAKSFELRAMASLARLLKRQGRRDEARALLAKVYNWFTEGFDTPDLKDAKALLEELAT